MFRAAISAVIQVWSCGVILLLPFFAVSWIRVHNLRRMTRTIPAESTQAIHTDVRRVIDIETYSTVLTSDTLHSPIATGIFQPSIILPTALILKLSYG